MIGLFWVAISALLLLILSSWKRKAPITLRELPALTRLYRAIGLSVEAGTRLHVALGHGNLLTASGASSLAGLAMLRHLSERTSVSDQPPVASAGDPALALLAQDTLQAGYQGAGAPELFQPTTGRLSGMGPFGFAAGSMTMIPDENVSTAILIGHFGPEAALLTESAERANAQILGASDDLSAQSVLFAAAQAPLIGEELFAAGAYLGAGPFHFASLTVQDIMRWLIILVLIGGAAARFIGAI
jgi:hypothetical protein